MRHYAESKAILARNITSTNVRTEPTLDWNLADANYDSSAIRKQFGALRGSHDQPFTNQERGILNLDPNIGWNQFISDAIVTFERVAIQMPFYTNMTAAMCA